MQHLHSPWQNCHGRHVKGFASGVCFTQLNRNHICFTCKVQVADQPYLFVFADGSRSKSTHTVIEFPTFRPFSRRSDALLQANFKVAFDILSVLYDRCIFWNSFSADQWVCLKIGYIPNYSHLIGIMIRKTIGFSADQCQGPCKRQSSFPAVGFHGILSCNVILP